MNTPINSITEPNNLATIASSLQLGGIPTSVRAELVEAGAALRQAQGERCTYQKAESIAQQEALASYELSKSRGNGARGLELLDKLDAHFQTAAQQHLQP